MFYTVMCSACEKHIDEWMVSNFEAYEKKKETETCPKCGEKGRIGKWFKDAPRVIYRGTGWSNPGADYRNGTQEKLEAELRENDRLAHDAKSRPANIRAEDAVRRATDQLENAE